MKVAAQGTPQPEDLWGHGPEPSPTEQGAEPCVLLRPTARRGAEVQRRRRGTERIRVGAGKQLPPSSVPAL